MSATPPFGPAYDEQPEDGPRSRPGQWRPRAGRPQGAQGGPNPGQGEPAQYGNGPYSPGGSPGDREQPPSGGPQGGRRPMPQAGRPSQDPRGGAPRAGGPAAGRGQQPGPYQPPQHQSPQQQPPQHQSPQQQQYSPQTGGYESRRPQQGGPVTGATPRTDQWNAGSPPRRDAGSQPNPHEYRPQPGAPAGAEVPQRKDEPFEEAAFADDRSRSDWGGGGETTAIGRLGYMPKEPRRRSDFQKVRSRARKSSPIPKIIIGVVALALVGGGAWWFLNRDTAEETGTGGDPSLTYAGSEEPCSLADPAPLESVVDGEPSEPVAEAEQKNTGWVQSCTMTYGEPTLAAALVEFDSTVYDSDAKASVNFELDTGGLGEQGEALAPVDPAPAIGDQSAAVARVVTDGTSTFHLHVQDDNVYLVVRLSVAKEAALDQQGLADLTTELANAYLENWREAR